jgi:hypothetical protein
VPLRVRKTAVACVAMTGADASYIRHHVGSLSLRGWQAWSRNECDGHGSANTLLKEDIQPARLDSVPRQSHTAVRRTAELLLGQRLQPPQLSRP